MKVLESNKLVRELMSNINVDVITGGYLRCPISWGEKNANRAFSKLYFILDGEGYIKIGDQEYAPSKNQLFLLPQGIPHSFHVGHAENTFLKHWIHFTARSGNVSLFDLIDVPAFVEIDDPQRLSSQFSLLHSHLFSNQITGALHARAAACSILALFFEKASHIGLKQNHGLDSLNQVLLYIDTNLNTHITIDEIAHVACLHPNYFINYFKKITGLSPLAYINQRRIDKAKQLLLLSEMSIKHIAAETGYKNEFYFSKSFKKHTGYSPSQFKQATQSM